MYYLSDMWSAANSVHSDQCNTRYHTLNDNREVIMHCEYSQLAYQLYFHS